MNIEVSEEEIQEAYRQAAVIVAKYGDVYLPIFERLETEIREIKKQKALLKKAIEVASMTGNKT